MRFKRNPFFFLVLTTRILLVSTVILIIRVNKSQSFKLEFLFTDELGFHLTTMKLEWMRIFQEINNLILIFVECMTSILGFSVFSFLICSAPYKHGDYIKDDYWNKNAQIKFRKLFFAIAFMLKLLN